jgi:Fe-S oxidoreductase
MTLREGNLEAPTRHPIDWRSADYRDEGKAFAEMERVFDICHGCRRCVSLCQSFPTLFDLDRRHRRRRGARGRQEGLRQGRRAVLPVRPLLHDQVPVRSAASVERRLPAPDAACQGDPLWQGRGRRGREAARVDRRARPARGNPIVVQAVNAANRTKPVRKVLQAALDVHPDAWLPPLASKRFRRAAKKKGGATQVVDGERSPGKVVLFSTCIVNYNEPGIGLDLLAVLEHNAIPYEVVEKESCCGMPKLELGDLEGVAELKEKNIPVLARYAREGFAILTAIPSCTLMFKQELPLMFPTTPTSRRCRRRCSIRSSTSSRAIATACSRPTSRARSAR